MREDKTQKYSQIYEKNKSNTLLDETRYILLLTVVDKCLEYRGSVCECGVYKGGSAAGILEIVSEKDAERPIHLFDTFAGVPNDLKSKKSFDKHHKFDDYSIDEFKKNFIMYDNLYFHIGRIPDTLVDVESEEFIFVHIDMNYYYPTKTALNFFYKHLSPNGVILVDDYGFDMYKDTVKRAVDEFSEENGVDMYPIDTGQCMIYNFLEGRNE